MKVTIHYLFSKRDLIGSKLIRLGTFWMEPNRSWNKTPSHVAVLISNRWVVESTMSTGIRVISYKKWKEINIEVAKIKCNQSRTMDEVKALFKPLKGKKYDYMGIAYFTWRIVLKALLGKEMPEQNAWHTSDKYFCCEVVGKLTGKNYEMTSPTELMTEVSKSAKLSCTVCRCSHNQDTNSKP